MTDFLDRLLDLRSRRSESFRRLTTQPMVQAERELEQQRLVTLDAALAQLEASMPEPLPVPECAPIQVWSNANSGDMPAPPAPPEEPAAA